MLDGEVQKLMEVTATLQVRDKKRIDVLWVDEDGDIWKSYTDQLQLRTFRCNRETAMVMKSAGTGNRLTRFRSTFASHWAIPN